MIRLDTVVLAATAIVVVSWLSFVVIMVLRPTPAAPTSIADTRVLHRNRRDRRSLIGIALQGVAYAIVWAPPQWGLARILERIQNSMWGPLTAVWLALIAAFMVAGVALARAAIGALGKQWTLVAQTAEGHRLVTTGPYARVRHPIYTAMLLLLLGTGLAMSSLQRLLLSVIIFAIGTAQRVKLEEELLDRRHGGEFQAYRTRVPAVVPRMP